MVHQVTLFTKGPAPNPLKVAIYLEELNVDYAVVDKVRSLMLIDKNSQRNGL